MDSAMDMKNCPDCGRKFATQAGLDKHMKSVHDKTSMGDSTEGDC